MQRDVRHSGFVIWVSGYSPLVSRGLSQRLLTVLQLTRMALVFTALADSLSATLILSAWLARDGVTHWLTPTRVLATAAMSIGLYGYGMSLNDIIDRRRDRQFAPQKPLPSGRIGVGTAHVVCVLLGSLAMLGGGWLAGHSPSPLLSFVLLLWTLGLISFYDFAGKYLVSPGILTLGLIQFFHATVPAPQLPLVWHPLTLMNHIAILSAIGYAWEQKRPTLRRRHWLLVIGGLALADAICVGLVWHRRFDRTGATFAEALWVTPSLLLPALAIMGFVVLALAIRLRHADSRAAGRSLMLFGLLWLIVYDAAFVAGYVSPLAGFAVFMLLPIAWLSVLVVRIWAQLIVLSQKPDFIRAR